MTSRIEHSVYHEDNFTRIVFELLYSDTTAAFDLATREPKDSHLLWNYRIKYLMSCAIIDQYTKPENWGRMARHWAEGEAAFQIAMRTFDGHDDEEKCELFGDVRSELNGMKSYLDEHCPLLKR